MAYRDHVEFAVGHGTGVHATRSTDDPAQAVRVETTAVPSYEVPRTDPPSPSDFPGIPQLGDVELDMAQLAVLRARCSPRAASPACHCLPRLDRTRAGAYRRPRGASG